MIKNNKLKKPFTHLIAILIFIGVGTVYFYPQLSGYGLKQHDSITSIGMAKECRDFRAKYHAEPLWTNSMFGGMPAYQVSLKNSNPINTLKNYILKLIPRPIGYMFLLMIGFYILLLCLDIRPDLAVIGALAFGLSSYNILYLAAGHNAKVHAISFIPPLLGGIIYGYRKNYLTGSVVVAVFVCLHITANHLQMTYYMLYLIFAIAIFQLYDHYKKKLLPKFFKASAFLLIGGILGIIPPIANLIVTKEYSKYSTRGKSELTIQSPNSASTSISKAALDEDYIKKYSLGFGEVWSLVIPDVKGGSMGYLGQDKELMKQVDPGYKKAVAQFSRYWGEQIATGGAFYFGASIFFLFILGAFFIRDKLKWAFIAISLLAVVLSWKYGKLTDFFIEHVPLYNKFRDTKMMLILVQISFSLLAMWGAQYLSFQTISKKKFFSVTLATLGIIFFFYAFPQVFFDFINRNELQYFENLHQNYQANPNALDQINGMQESITHVRVELFRKDCLRSLFFIAITAIAVFLFLAQKIKRTYYIVGLGAIVLLDLWSVDKRYLNNEKQGSAFKQWVNKYEYSNPFRATVADKAIFEAELSGLPGLKEDIDKELAGFKPAKGLTSGEIKNEKDKIRFRELNLHTDYRVLSLSNPFSESRTSYFHKSIGGYHGAKLKKYQELIEFYISNEINGFIGVLKSNATPHQIDSILQNQFNILNMLNTKYIIYNTGARPITNKFCFGETWFVKHLEFVKNADEEITALGGHMDKSRAIVQQQYANIIPKDLGYDSTATIELTEYLPNHLTYRSQSEKAQAALFSEIYYDAGWNAYINGTKVDYFKANYLLRGLIVPSGENVIEFKFEPKSYYRGRSLSMVGSGLIFVYAFGIFFYERRKQRKEQQ